MEKLIPSTSRNLDDIVVLQYQCAHTFGYSCDVVGGNAQPGIKVTRSLDFTRTANGCVVHGIRDARWSSLPISYLTVVCTLKVTVTSIVQIRRS